MNVSELFQDSFGRIREVVHQVVDGLGVDELEYRIDGRSNSIAWLVWHLTRIQDDHIAGVAHLEQVWTAGGWMERFGLPFDDRATGYGQGPEDVAAFKVEAAEQLTAYHDAVYDQTVRFLADATDEDLDRVVDKAWDPPVTMGVRLVSIVADDLQHAGQAAYVRGVLESSA